VQLWDPATGQQRRTLRHRSTEKYGDRIEVVAFGPGGNLLVSANVYDARLWDVRTGQEARVLGDRKTDVGTYQTMAAAFSLDGRLCATGDYNGNVRLWNPSTGKHRRTFKSESRPSIGHGVHVSSMALSPDGRQLAVGKYVEDDSACVQVWA
jgi:WD40 repeat protein